MRLRDGSATGCAGNDISRRSLLRHVATGAVATAAGVVLPGQAWAQASSGAAEWRERFDVSTPQASAGRSNGPIAGQRALTATEWAVDQYRQIVGRGGWQRVPEGPNLRLGASSPNVPALRQRLIATGDLQQGGGRGDIYDSFVEAAVRRFQQRHGIGADGIVRAATYREMNVPAEVRLQQLELNLRRVRNMQGAIGDRYVMMNIPAAELEAVQGGNVANRYTTVVGKIDRQSPVLAVFINQINFNPYWTVPTSIVRRDMIPQMQRDPNYLTRLRIRIFDQRGQELQPNQIDWNTEQAVAFRFRQDPSDINSMGNVRIGMPNPEAVYMHDTPQKGLFGSDTRFHSSGCARVQNVRELVTWLLSEQAEWPRARIDHAIRSDERIDVRLRRPVPVYWVYVTSWATDDGLVQFRNDIYRLDERHLAGDFSRPATPFDPTGGLQPGMRIAAR